jgi:predicted CopG family antitoxin
LFNVFGEALRTPKKKKSFVIFVQCGGSRKKEEVKGTKKN